MSLDNEIVNGRREVTPSTTLRLAHAVPELPVEAVQGRRVGRRSIGDCYCVLNCREGRARGPRSPP